MAKKSNAGRRKVRFEVRAEPGSTVYVAGTFNKWDPARSPLKLADDESIYEANLMIPKGTHQYKFVINGIWCVDPNCPEWVPNDQGSLNSQIVVK